ncbi:MAG: HAMP domain-containing protein [Bdellovibrionales bacterium]|nr:HAMP domain-containing protein [Bdellovibrionales bacterium]
MSTHPTESDSTPGSASPASARVRFPIRTKLLLLMSALVLAAILTYLFLAIKLFKDDKTVLVYELNVGNVRTVSAELKAELTKSADKVKLLTSGYQDDSWVRTVLGTEEELVSYSLFRPDGASWARKAWVVRGEYLKLYGEDAAAYERSRARPPVSPARVIAERAVVTRTLLPTGAPLLTLSLALNLGAERAPAVAVMDLRLDAILERLRKGAVATVYVVNADGELVAHPDPDFLRSEGKVKDLPIVKAALASRFAVELTRFDAEGKGWLGAHADVGFAGLKVISQTREDVAFQAADRLISKSVLFGLLIVTVVILLSSRLAGSLTGPLGELVDATERVARWDFGAQIRVNTSDEVAQLAQSFNTMSTGLKIQREQIDRHQAELEQKVKERTAELETQKKKAAEANEALVRTTRLASLGEMAGMTAHEVLNPVNNLGIRVEKMKGSALKVEPEEFALLSEIVAAWEEAYKNGGWDAFASAVRKPAQGGEPMIEEDLKNLAGIARDHATRLKQREGDFSFLSQEIGRIAKIVNNMRSLSRVNVERKALDVHAPIEDTLAAFSDLFEREGVKVELLPWAGDRSEARVMADKDELVQVFSNLLRNGMQAVIAARKSDSEGASAKRGLRVRVQATPERVEVRVEDDGTGIAPENRAQLFEPHFTTKSADEGTGLGLSISRRLVRAFDGDIELERSERGLGSIFTVWMPRLNSSDS